nr:LLM class flavin-dependent oxidoreductase [Rhodococcus koreensis]
MKLSILDRSRTRRGAPDSAALTGTIERAVHAEHLGFERFWVAEHHAVPGIASGSPPLCCSRPSAPAPAGSGWARVV